MIDLQEISVQAITIIKWIHSLNKGSNNILSKLWCWYGDFPIFGVGNARGILAEFLKLADQLVFVKIHSRKSAEQYFFNLRNNHFEINFLGFL